MEIMSIMGDEEEWGMGALYLMGNGHGNGYKCRVMGW